MQDISGGFNSNIVNTSLNDSIEDKRIQQNLLLQEIKEGFSIRRKVGLKAYKEYIELPDIPTSKRK